jgi:nitrite reductase/ring-hydroxylating ferredoxin subunit
VLGRIGELRAAGGPLVIYCHKGIRSGHVAIQLGDRGVRAQSLRGGIESWMAAGGAIVAPQPNGAQAQPAAPPPARSFVRVGAAADLGPGQSAVVEASGRSIAIFNVGGSFFAVDNRCLHRGGSLGQGELSGTTVRCPEHGWRYDVTTGRREGGAATLVCFAVRVTEGQLEVAL